MGIRWKPVRAGAEAELGALQAEEARRRACCGTCAAGLHGVATRRVAHAVRWLQQAAESAKGVEGAQRALTARFEQQVTTCEAAYSRMMPRE